MVHDARSAAREDATAIGPGSGGCGGGRVVVVTTGQRHFD